MDFAQLNSEWKTLMRAEKLVCYIRFSCSRMRIARELGYSVELWTEHQNKKIYPLVPLKSSIHFRCRERNIMF